ncbi:MAG: sulfatase-like hydrolase/transferase [Minicystis sp.]
MHLLFCLQLVALDLALRGPAFYGDHPRALGYLAASAALLHLLAAARPGRAARVAIAVAIGIAVALQAGFFRYYHAPLDDQAALAARLAWGDVRPVAERALPALAAIAILVAAVEYLWLSRSAPRPGYRRIAVAALVIGVAVGGPVRWGTTEIRTAHAATSFALPPPPPPRRDHRVLPPLTSRRARVPSVLFILTESVRAPDWCGDASEPCALAPETHALLPDRIALREMRSVTSYTAVSMSVLLTGLAQIGPREPIATAPDLFDIARATRDAGRALGVHYWSAHAPSFFERADPASAVDSYVTGESMLGHPIEDVEQEAVMGGLDRRLADECRQRIPALSPPYVAMVHFAGTHAPYFFDDASAPFKPFGRVVTWRGMEDLHRSYRNAMVEQDRSIAACVRAFVTAQRDRPYLIVFTSDHGESFGDHWAIHHGQHLYDEQIHVPAFIASGNGALEPDEARALAAAKDAFVTHFDVLPTILDALGVLDHFALSHDVSRLPGRSLLRPRPADPPALPITNCTGMWQCPLNAWGVLQGDRKLFSQVWDGEWRCLTLRDGEREVDLGQCADLVKASRAFFPEKPNGVRNE